MRVGCIRQVDSKKFQDFPPDRNTVKTEYEIENQFYK
jgi:hypothetical protein